MSEQGSVSQTGGPIDREIDVRGIVKVGVWLAVVTLAGFLIAWGFYRFLSRGEKQHDPKPSPIAEAARPQIVPGPPLQATPEVELAAFRKSEEARLATWAWIDKAHGIAEVPVEKAIDAVAAEGALPTFLPPEAGAGQ
jgi:hypothetical protein